MEPVRATFRVPPDLYTAVKAISSQEDRSVNSQTIAMLRFALMHWPKRNAPAALTTEASNVSTKTAKSRNPHGKF